MMYLLSRLFDFVSEPGNLLVILLALGALMLPFGLGRAAAALVVTIAVLEVGITVLPVGSWISAPLEDRFPQPHLPDRIDGIVLLGGAVREAMSMAHHEVALNGMAERITETLALARRYPGVPVVISGGDASLTRRYPPEADLTRTLLVEDGLDPARIRVEERSRNTYENAVYSKEVAAPQPGQVWLLVTSANHMPRAVGCFRQIGFAVLPVPVDYHSGTGELLGFDFTGDLETMTGAIHEWAGLVAYRVLGRTDALFPGPR